jgi:hypothetical protein
MADTIYGPDPWSDLRREFTVDHADLRRELAVGQGEIRYDIASSAAATRTENAAGQGEIRTQINAVSDIINSDIKDTGWKVNERVGYEADRLSKEQTDFFIAGQQRNYDTAIELAKVAATQLAGFADISDRVVTASEINALKTQLTVKEDGELTRGLINNLKNDELNRMLIERNTDVNHFRHGYWDALGAASNAQFAAVSSNLNAFQSQLQETRQGMVNFGTMAGVRQDSTSNNVR